MSLTSGQFSFYIPNSKADGFENKSLEETQHTYFYKHLIILGGLFFFFIFERSMKLFAIHKTIVSSQLSV